MQAHSPLTPPHMVPVMYPPKLMPPSPHQAEGLWGVQANSPLFLHTALNAPPPS